ncbi:MULTISPECIES: hypothetical protein [Streptomyces]|uniref:hypothetical protein n=1 Tax=Streptomyces TaxID=1883 RepID=UPI00367F3610
MSKTRPTEASGDATGPDGDSPAKIPWPMGGQSSYQTTPPTGQYLTDPTTWRF